MRIILLIVFALLPLQLNATEIIWKVAHPFRYYKQRSDLAIHQWAFEQLQVQKDAAGNTIGMDRARYAPISHIERMLNNPTWWKNNPELLDRLKQLRVAEGRSAELNIRLGWGSFLTGSAPQERGAIDQTCWNDRRRIADGRARPAQRYALCNNSEWHGTTGKLFHYTRKKHQNRYRIKTGHYIYPKFHRVVIALEDFPQASGECTWKADQPIFLKTGDPGKSEKETETWIGECREPVHARLKFRPPDHPEHHLSKVKIEVAWNGGMAGPAELEVRDFLIFALGDSYSSGEGNPEIPAKLHPWRAIGEAYPKGVDTSGNTAKRYYGVPRRSPANSTSAAVWTDRRCHRSVYSYQTRVALQLAIAPDKEGHHHHAVTYLQFTCSGAEVTEDLLYAWEGRECMQAAIANGTHNGPKHPYYSPQITKASQELCQTRNEGNGLSYGYFTDLTGQLHADDHYRSERAHWANPQSNRKPACRFRRWNNDTIKNKPFLAHCTENARAREIDLIISSAGGNDIGFSKIVAKAIVNDQEKLIDTIGKLPVLGAIMEKALFVDKEEAFKRLGRLSHRLEMYNKSLVNFLGAKPGNVIAVTYPSMIYDKDGKLCPGDNSVSDVSRFLKINGPFLAKVEEIVEKKCDADGSNCGLVDLIRTRGKNMGWRVVDSHRDLFKTHGICAFDPALSPDESGRGKAEELGIPYKLVDETKPTTEEVYAAPWQRFDPVLDYYPYESRQTGFRSPNQDFLNIQYYKESMPDRWKEKTRESAIFLAKRILGGSFHPTAEAHAHMADHTYCHARAVLFDEECDAAKLDMVKTFAYRWGK